MSTDLLAELKALPQWTPFRGKWNAQAERTDKPPIDIHKGESEIYADPTDPATWSTYDEAMNYALYKELISAKKGGVGFMFNGNGLAAIDLDHVLNDKGELKEWANDIVQTMNTYTEISFSGDGLHLIFKLSVPYKEICSRNKNQDLGLEVYDTKRFLTVSQKIYGEPKPIQDRTEELKKVCAKYMPQTEKKSSIADWVHTPRINDNDIWQRMFNSPNGKAIQELYLGHIDGYGSRSEADLALCSHLAFWTAKDPREMDRLFRKSGLMRPKWDDKHGDFTYGQITIAKAIDTVGNTYEQRNSQQEPQTLPHEHREEEDLLAYLDSGFHSDLAYFASFKNRKTGFQNIDKFTSLYPGLYVVGGVSGAGKTTFCHQIADNLARAGEYVLFFSLEQTRFELASKGIARLTAQDNMVLAKTALEIRNGSSTDAVKRAVHSYKEFANHEVIIECGFGATVDFITDYVQNYIQSTGRKPVIFIDYLQIINPSSSKRDTKEAVDDIVHALKKLQADNGLVMFVISSFNRTNYLNVADFESFKESGLIEYSADVVWALQLLAMNAGIFDTQSKLQSKRNFVHEQKNLEPRKIELIGLKNRYGRSYTRYFFNYCARYDLFTPYDITEEEADKEVQEAFDAYDEKHGGGKKKGKDKDRD